MKKEATATLMGSRGNILTSLEELAAIPTPERTKTWHPIPHVVIPEIIDRLMDEKGWDFVDPDNRYQFSVSKDGAKMFGVTKVLIPDVMTSEEFQMAIGFRNSHDKSFALRVAMGTHVTVCDNMMITGDIQVRRIHWNNIDPEEAMNLAFLKIPEAAKQISGWFKGLQDIPITAGDGVALLAECVAEKALPIFQFMDARESFLKAYQGDSETILHGDSMWGVYQAVTEQFKTHNLSQTQHYSINLNKVINERTGHIIETN